jgi:FtsH-binding integral membrane protein
MKKSNIKNRKDSRTEMEDTISPRTYNAILGGTLLYGFLVNALLVLVARPLVEAIDPVVFLIGYLVSALVGALIANKSSNPAISFVGYNLIVVPVGLLLAIVLPGYDARQIFLAALLTGVVTLVMMLLTVSFPNFFASLGSTLFWSLLICVAVEFIALLLGYGGDIFNWIFVAIFSLYIGYDWHRAQVYSKTVDNAIDSAVDLYLDIINVFLRILDLLDN